MPPLIRRYIKTSFEFLLVGLALGGYIIVDEFVTGSHPPPLFITAQLAAAALFVVNMWWRVRMPAAAPPR